MLLFSGGLIVLVLSTACSFVLGLGVAEPLYCLSCSSVISPRHCHNIRKCEEGQVCYTEKFTNYNGETLYNVGCHTASYCNLTNFGNPLDMTSNNHIEQCVECCNGIACNSHGCNSKDYPATRGPICFSCQQTTDPSLCRTVRVCNEDEVCYVHEIHEFGERFFSSMCLQRQICNAYNSGSVFGRKRFVPACSTCCEADLCNRNCGRLPVDCFDIYTNGQRKSGVYKIYPSKDLNDPVQVMCNMDIQGGGWTVIQFRSRDNPSVDFNVTWDKYEKGFGDVHGNFWLGNSVIHQLTTMYNNSLYITMKKLDGSLYHAQYSSFSVSNETDGFRLSLGKLSGNVSDEFRDHPLVGKEFYTFDHDNADKCSVQCGSGWWYGSCALVNLNAPFSGIHRDPVWNGAINKGSALRQSSMLIKRLE